MRLLPAMLLSALASLAQAEEQPVVVELFTSQGCASCPPADAMLAEIADMDGVIALAFHVDYWDYLGWPDSFASRRMTERQKAYGRLSREQIYTPQVVVNGQDREVGSRAMEVMELVHAHTGAESPVALSVARHGEGLSVEAEAEGPIPPLEVHLVRYRPSQTVTIERGENAGMTIAYSNIVTSWQTLGEWSGEAALSMRVPAPGMGAAVVLLQEAGPGRIVAAEEVR